MSEIGTCPTCGEQVLAHDKRCKACGETSFLRIVRRRGGNTRCYDCTYNHHQVDSGCHRCHGFGYVVVYFAWTVDLRTGKRGREMRYEAAPDTWEAENVS